MRNLRKIYKYPENIREVITYVYPNFEEVKK